MPRAKIIAAAKDDPEGSGAFPFNWRRYIAFLIDTDNNAATGYAPDFAGMNHQGKEGSDFAGCNAWGIIYPFRGNASTAGGTDGLEIVNGVEEQGGVAVIDGVATTPEGADNKVTAFGKVDDDFVYVECGFAKSAIGSPASENMKMMFSLAWDLTDIVAIVNGVPVVQPKPTTAVITANGVSVEVGKTASIGATINSGATLSYQSANSSIATVSSTGVVTGVAAGSTTITISAPAVEGYTAASTTINVIVTSASQPDGIKIDGSLGEWANIEAQGEFHAIKEWKYGFNNDYMCFYFKIARSGIIAAKTDDPAGSGQFPFNWRRYMGFMIDTDNNAATGSNPKFIGINDPEDPESAINGCEAWGIVYPFRGNASEASGTDGVQVVNGVDSQGGVAVIKEGVSKPDADPDKLGIAAYGTVDDDFVYMEVGVPLAGIGNPADGSTMNLRFSFSYDLSDVVTITK